ncbi:vesicle transport through interaction with t-SNAREs homolog 1A-like [Daphnia carinata]|uniref:vesicle transport through interaction with t-SNAREs homolog 1A-like n=1 Tax=Daphnia carinata TaxID=120202 RepID=UPI002579443A|nr:vesicle transport through interaction with t-SNAREs homolog 1A-like [Daphnia carinata]
MESLLKSYEQQFSVTTASITAKTATLNGTITAEDKKSVVQQIVRELEETKDILEQMGLEVRELDATSKNKYFTRIESYRVELSRLEKEFNNKRLAKCGDREELFGDAEVEDACDHNQFLINSEKLERGKSRLEAGYQVVVETEQIGNNILADLNHQRETIQRTRNRLTETDEELGRSGRLLNHMLVRIIHNRLILVGLISIFALFIIITLYIKFRANS